MKIELGKRYRSDNRKGRVIAVDRNHLTHSVVFLIDDGKISTFRADGGYYSFGESNLDLQEIPKTYWVNVYPTSDGVHPTRESADKYADRDRIACIKVMEGEFHED